MYKDIIKWLSDYLDSSGLDAFVVGVSGGIDSALVSTICAKTKKKTILVSMPIHQAPDQLERANNHMNWLKQNHTNVECQTKDLSSIFDSFKNLFGLPEHRLSLANSRSRLRMVTLYQIAGINNGLVVGTGNKIEDFGIGFFTKYGDGGVDVSPIADLTKTEVKELSQTLGISSEIINAAPTDGLWDDNRTDENQIGATYKELEWAMDYIDSNKNTTLSYRQEEVINIFLNFRNKNKHKIKPIPIYKKNISINIGDSK